MNGTGSLGNDDLLYGNDPFISGATSSQGNFNIFDDDFYGDSLFGTDKVNNNHSQLDQDVEDGGSLGSFSDFGDYGNIGESNNLFSYNYGGISYDHFLNFDPGNSEDVELEDQVQASSMESVQEPTRATKETEVTEKSHNKMSNNNGMESVETMTSRMDLNDSELVNRRTVAESSHASRSVAQNNSQQKPSILRRKDGSIDLSNQRMKYIKSSATGYQKVYTNNEPPATGNRDTSKQKVLFPVKVLPIPINKFKRHHPYKEGVAWHQAEIVQQTQQIQQDQQTQEGSYQVMEQSSLNSPNENIVNEGYYNQVDDCVEYFGVYPEQQQPVEVVKPQTTRISMASLVKRDTKSNLVKCNMCSSTFNNRLSLEFHEVERHSGVYAFKCAKCTDVFATLRCASDHLTTVHQLTCIPMYDKSIIGNALENTHPRNVQRRISGMIFSFLNKHLAKLGLLTGNPRKDHDLIKEYSKKLDRPIPLSFKLTCPDESKTLDTEAVQTVNLNEMLNKKYIYGEDVYRVPIQSVDQNSIIYPEVDSSPMGQQEQWEDHDDMNYMNVPDSGSIIVRQVPVYTNPTKKTFVIRYPLPQQQQEQQKQRPRIENSPNYRYTLNNVPMRINSNPDDRFVSHPEKEEYSTTGGRKLYKVRAVVGKVPVNQNLQPSSSSQYHNYQ
ncbi:unnamed protein product [Caenorhabditis brenneri]